MLNNYITKVTILNYYNNSINYYLCMARTLLATREYKKNCSQLSFFDYFIEYMVAINKRSSSRIQFQ